MLGSAGISSAGGLAGSMLAGKQSYKYTKKIMQNKHQWETADLRKAGLNPVLSANGGGSSPGVSFPSPGTIDLSGALEKNSSTKLKDQQSELTKNQGELTKKQGDLTDAQIKTQKATESAQRMLAKKLQGEAFSAHAEAMVREKSAQKQLESDLLQWSDALNRAGGFNAVNSAKGLIPGVKK